MKILIVDDENAIRKTFKMVLTYAKHNVVEAKTAEEAFDIAKKGDIDIVFLDVKLPQKSGLDIVPDIKKVSPSSYIIIVTGHGNVIDAVKAVKMGVYDYIEKPVSVERIKFLINNIKEEKKIITAYSRVIGEQSSFELIGNDDKINEIRKMIFKVADSNATILITGENGTGKEIVARLIHKDSNLKGKFVTVNCAALPDELIESELFGYKKGAFTGAEKDSVGKIEFADGGTLFLDEIGDMSKKTQAKLLRVLQFRRFSPLGDTNEKEVQIRFIAATNRNLRECVEKEAFREDLFFRLNEIPIFLPPLKERKNDIPILIKYFQNTFISEDRFDFTDTIMEYLINYNYPGNVRELKNFLKRILLLSEKKPIDEEEFLHIIPEIKGQIKDKKFTSPASYNEYMDLIERDFIQSALEKANWNISKTAKNINMQRSNLYKKIQKYNLQKDEID